MTEGSYSDQALRAVAEAAEAQRNKAAAEDRTARQLELAIEAVQRFSQNGLNALWDRSDAIHKAIERRHDDAITSLRGEIREADRQSENRDREHRETLEKLTDDRVNALTESMSLWHTSHMLSHQTQKATDNDALAERVRANNANIDQWRTMHAAVHDEQALAVRVALSEVAKLADLHATAHAQQHLAHEEIHARERAAAEKADRILDQRLTEINHIRQGAAEERRSYVTREVMESQLNVLSGRLEAGNRERTQLSEEFLQLRGSSLTRDAIDDKIANASAAAREAEKSATKRLDALEKQVASGNAATTRTQYLIATLFGLIAAVAAILAIYNTLKK